jgi:peptidylprolyl isomerase
VLNIIKLKEKKMRLKLLNALGIFLIIAAGCGKIGTWGAQEQAQIDKYIKSLGDTVYSLKPSGLYSIELVPGTGKTPGVGDMVSFKYMGMFLDRVSFDNNLASTTPFSSRVGTNQLRAGIDEGLRYMKEGGKSRFVLPSKLAFGEVGIYGYIPGYTPVLYEIELIAVIQGTESAVIQNFISSLGDTAYSLKTSGLYYIESVAGTGRTPVAKDTVYLKYRGMFLNRLVFDSNLTSTTPFKVVIGKGQIIPGMEEGIKYMKEGGVARFVIPSTLGYGTTGSQGVIPPNTPLLFEVTLVSSKPGPPK